MENKFIPSKQEIAKLRCDDYIPPSWDEMVANADHKHIPWNTGKEWSDEIKKSISSTLSGRKLSNDHKKKISEGNRKTARKVLINNVVYNSVLDAAEKTGIKANTIYYRCNSKNNKHFSFMD
mgnify:CR=1 FL=1